LADNVKRHQADVQFNKLQRVEDGKKAVSEYEAAGAAMRARTAQLKALRLARDAELKVAAPAAAAPAKKKRAGKKQPATSLSDWLKDREGSGHNS
jgi:hypothetical protein